MVRFKHHHFRCPKTSFLAQGVQRYACLERHPAPTAQFLAWCVSNTTILGVQNHVFWPRVCSGMGGWSATPESKQYFLASCVSNTPILGIQKHLFWPMVRAGMGGWRATPESTQYFLVRGVTAHLGYSGLHYGYFQVCFTCERTLRACTPEQGKKGALLRSTTVCGHKNTMCVECTSAAAHFFLVTCLFDLQYLY